MQQFMGVKKKSIIAAFLIIVFTRLLSFHSQLISVYENRDLLGGELASSAGRETLVV